MGRKKAGRRRKRKTQKPESTAEVDASQLPPRAFVFTKGKVPAAVKALVEDLKRVMSPNTAQDLKAQKRNKLRDFVDVAGALHVSFFLILSATDKHCYLRLVRSPRGPTLTFRVNSYSLASDVSASARKPYSPADSVWLTAPMLVLSNFDKTKQHEALSATMLQNLFPTLNVATAKLAQFRRVVLVHQLPESEGGHCELRQYVIKAAPTGVTRGVKKLVRATRKLPSLGRLGDVADFLTGNGATGGYSSDSGAETDDEDKADLPQNYIGRQTKAGQKVSIKLHEVGPRLSLSLLKVEEGLCDGATLYHSLVSKTEGEAAETAARIEARAKLKADRRAAQQANVDRKKAALEEKAKGKKRRGGPYGMGGGDGDGEDDGDGDDDDEAGGFEGDSDLDDDAEYGDGADIGDKECADQEWVDDDAAYYREAVGEEPEADLGLKSRTNPGKPYRPADYQKDKGSAPKGIGGKKGGGGKGGGGEKRKRDEGGKGRGKGSDGKAGGSKGAKGGGNGGGKKARRM